MIEEKVTIHHGKLKRIPAILQFGPARAPMPSALQQSVKHSVVGRNFDNSNLRRDSVGCHAFLYLEIRNKETPCGERHQNIDRHVYVLLAGQKSAGFAGDGDDNIPSMDHHPGAKKSIEGEWDSPRIAPSN